MRESDYQEIYHEPLKNLGTPSVMGIKMTFANGTPTFGTILPLKQIQQDIPRRMKKTRLNPIRTKKMNIIGRSG